MQAKYHIDANFFALKAENMIPELGSASLIIDSNLGKE